jgi:hypothetical protein
MARGWVYVMTNEAMPNLVKVGFTLKDTELRAQELSNTGVPGKWIVKYEVFVIHPRDVEQKVHKLLSEYLHSKEFFTCPVQVAIAAIEEVSADCYQYKLQENPLEIKKEESIGNYSGIWFENWTGNGLYEGQVLNGKRHGTGKFSANAGKKRYEGEWKDNCFHGWGILESDVERYDGIWSNGEFKSGIVCKEIGIAELYEGEWRDGERNGKGRLSGRLGEIYEGMWKNGKRNGFGKQVYVNGKVYEGEWSENYENGFGKLIYPDGNVYEGIWKDGELCEESNKPC